MKRALFLKTKHLGDSVVLTSAIEALPSGWSVDVLCFPDSAPIFRMQPRVSKVYVTSRGIIGFARRLVHQAKTFLELRQHRYDLVAQFSDDWRGAWIARALSPPVSVAIRSHKRPALWHRSFSACVKRPKTARHVAELDVDLLRGVGLYGTSDAPAYRLIPPVSAEHKVQAFLKTHGLEPRHFVVLHAAARWRFKGLPNATWQSMMNDLSEQGYRLVISGAPADLSFNEELISGLRSRVTLCQDFDLSTTAALYKQALAVVSIDSLAIHLSSAVGTPVFAVFGPSGEKHWRPWRVPHRVFTLDEQFPCRPCGLDGCGGSKRSQCLEQIPAGLLTRSVGDFLQNLRTGQTNIDSTQEGLS